MQARREMCIVVSTETPQAMPACTDMVYSKELERGVSTTAMALPRLKTLASFLHST